MAADSRAGPRRRFASLHREGTFLLANAHDVGSARLLAEIEGVDALATTSAGHAATLGRSDMSVTLDELVAHTAALVDATPLPVSVDAESGFADSPAGVAETVDALAAVGAAGCSIEDYDSTSDRILPPDTALARVEAAVEAAAGHGMTVTARCEHHLHGVDDLDATIDRLRAFVVAGAQCVYAPGLRDPDDIRRVVAGVEAPVNVLLWPRGPDLGQLADLGVRRVSLGSRLTHLAFGAVHDAVTRLLEDGDLPAGPRVPGSVWRSAMRG